MFGGDGDGWCSRWGEKVARGVDEGGGEGGEGDGCLSEMGDAEGGGDDGVGGLGEVEGLEGCGGEMEVCP